MNFMQFIEYVRTHGNQMPPMAEMPPVPPMSSGSQNSYQSQPPLPAEPQRSYQSQPQRSYQSQSQPQSQQSASIYVSGLPKDVTTDEVANFFGQIGMIKVITIFYLYLDEKRIANDPFLY